MDKQAHEAWVRQWCERMQKVTYRMASMIEQAETELAEMQALYIEAQKYVEKQLEELKSTD